MKISIVTRVEGFLIWNDSARAGFGNATFASLFVGVIQFPLGAAFPSSCFSYLALPFPGQELDSTSESALRPLNASTSDETLRGQPRARSINAR